MPLFEHVKRAWANFRNQPWIWVDMGHLTIDAQGMIEIRYEYNEQMISYLKTLNYHGENNDEIVQKYIERCYLYISNDEDSPFEGVNYEPNDNNG